MLDEVYIRNLTGLRAFENLLALLYLVRYVAPTMKPFVRVSNRKSLLS